jgi:hypothetical protein
MSFFPRAFHAWIDYPVALLLIVAPFLLGLTTPIAIGLSVVTGIAAFILTVLTDHETGLFKVIPYKLHLIVDGIVGATFVIAPFILGLQGLEMAYFLVLGVTVLVVVAGHRAETTPAA